MMPLPPEEAWVFLVWAFLSPLLVALFKQSGFQPQANALIALAVYVVVGIAGAVWSGLPVDVETVIPLIATATVVGHAAYAIVWDNLGRTTALAPSLDDQLTAATTVVR